MPQLVKYQYGDYTHEPGEVVDFQWRESANHTKRMYRETAWIDARLIVELQACDWATLNAKIEALRDAYSYNDRLFAVIGEDGSPTMWTLDPANPDMIRIAVHVASNPQGTMEELVVQRTFEITIRALKEAAEDQLIEYVDSVSRIGNCGIQRVTQPTINSGVRTYIIWPQTTQKLIQQGKSLGFKGYYSPDPTKIGGTIPILGPAFEHLEQRVDAPGKPQRMGPNFYYYPWEWRYVFESLVPLDIYPS